MQLPLASADATASLGCDPVTLEIARGALRATLAEMEAVIERTAMSPFIREKKDFFAALLDEHGRLVIGSGLPITGEVITPIAEHYPPDTMSPGDIFWFNDCYGSGGAVSHSPDLVLVAPVFSDGNLVAYAQSWAHFSDIGGMRPGSMSPDCTEIFQEGIIVPPTRLAHKDVLNDELLRLFFRNSRLPAMVQGDTRASIAAVRLGVRRLTELFDRFGAAKLTDGLAQLIGRTEQLVRSRLRDLVPPGEYRFTDRVDSDGQGHGPIHLRYGLSVTADRIELDTTESDNQVPGPVNFLMNRSVPLMVFGDYLLGGDRECLLNAGAEQVVDEVKLREGSVLQPRFPAPLGLRGVTLMRNVAGCLGLLAVATGGNAMASHSAYVIWNLRGLDDDGTFFLMSDGMGVGYGARPYADGHDAVFNVGQENYPAEFLDAVYPLRVLRYAINADTGGAGRWRGGCGIVREVEVLASEALVSVRIDSVENPPWGTAGGKQAGVGGCVINPGRPDERRLAPLSDGNKVRRGDVIRVETGGGGGWGHPYDREPERVLDDVLAGFVSHVNALSEYGVVLAADGTAVDHAATTKQRSTQPATQLFHRGTYRGALD
jgi:N-methylhydantoinase B